MPVEFLSDTSPDASAAQRAAWRAMTPSEKLEQVRALTRTVLWLEREGLRRRHPSFDPAQLHRAAIERRLGPELSARVYASSPRER
jgi:Xaa-Pro aminopeptidase